MWFPHIKPVYSFPVHADTDARKYQRSVWAKQNNGDRFKTGLNLETQNHFSVWSWCGMCYITAGDVNSLKQRCIKRFIHHESYQTEPKPDRETLDCVRRRMGICAALGHLLSGRPWSWMLVLHAVLKERDGGSRPGRTSQEVHGAPVGPLNWCQEGLNRKADKI